MQIENDIPFYRTLRFKLFASYCVLLLVTSLVTLFVHVRGVAVQIESFFEGDFMPFATELKTGMEKRLAASESFDSLLYQKRETSPYRVLFLPFASQGEEPVFVLSSAEREKITAGEPVEGSATERVQGWGAQAGQPGFRRMMPNRFVALPILKDDKVEGALVVFDMQPNPEFRRKRVAASAAKSLSIVMLLAVFAAYLLSRHLTKPIGRMETFAQEFSGGELSARTGLKRRDELGVLAHAFDDMAHQIESNAATRTRLLSDVSHELGTPVATIRATLEAIVDDLLPPEEHKAYLESSLHQLEHLSRIVNDVTDLSRFETGRISLHQAPFLADLPVRRAVEAARAVAEKKGVKVEAQAHAAEVQVLGDVQRLTQVLKNLVMNAVQHNPEGTTVRASCKADKKEVVYTVEDDGPPVPEKDASQIFERFYKASESRTRDGTSSGLGLAIVRRILLQHDSDVSFSQQDGKKSFVFRLPRVKP